MIDAKQKNIAVTLTGNLQTDPLARAKYGDFISALDRRLTLLGVIDAEIAGLPRFVNALRSFHPDPKKWKERFRKNPLAHQFRSRTAGQRIGLISRKIDFVLQLGALFDALPSESTIPTYVYTDYTHLLAAEKPGAGRSPFSPKGLLRLVDLERQTFSRAERIFVRSQLVRDSIVDQYQIEGRKVSLVGAGVNFDPLPAIKEKAFSNRLLFIGLDFHRKGGDILLEAFKILKKQAPSTELLLVTRGQTPNQDLLEGVKVIPPTWDREKLSELYRSADLFVLPSRLETWGDVLLEAMAFGVPCVGVQQDAMGEIITHGQNGYLVPGNDPQALADALIDLLSAPMKIREMGKDARKKIEQNFTWDLVVDRMLAEIEN